MMTPKELLEELQKEVSDCQQILAGYSDAIDELHERLRLMTMRAERAEQAEAKLKVATRGFCAVHDADSDTCPCCEAARQTDRADVFADLWSAVARSALKS